MNRSSLPLSRRGLLGAFAGAAGASILGPAALAAAAPASASASLVPFGASAAATNSVSATVAATVSTWLPCFFFQPSSGASTYDYGGSPGLAHSSPNEFFFTTLEFEPGRTITHLSAYVDPKGLTFRLFLFRLPVRPTTLPAAQIISQTTSTAGALTVVELDVNHVVAANFVYLIMVGLGSGAQFHGVDVVHDEAPAGFVPVNQTRKLDTRTGSVLPVGSIVTVDLAPEIPAGAQAAVVTLTATGTQGGGFLTAFPGPVVTAPNVSTLNWTQPGQDVANTAVISLQGATSIKVAVGGQAGTAAHILVDTVGYFS